MNFLYGILTATALIIAAEIKFNYGLGDKVKDLYLWAAHKILGLFGEAKEHL